LTLGSADSAITISATGLPSLKSSAAKDVQAWENIADMDNKNLFIIIGNLELGFDVFQLRFNSIGLRLIIIGIE
jgi:hypothetical protein